MCTLGVHKCTFCHSGTLMCLFYSQKVQIGTLEYSNWPYRLQLDRTVPLSTEMSPFRTLISESVDSEPTLHLCPVLWGRDRFQMEMPTISSPTRERTGVCSTYQGGFFLNEYDYIHNIRHIRHLTGLCSYFLVNGKFSGWRIDTFWFNFEIYHRIEMAVWSALYFHSKMNHILGIFVHVLKVTGI